MLAEWRMVTPDRDNRVRGAVSAGVSKYRVNQLTGIGRSTIDRILAAAAPAGPSMGHLEAAMITDMNQGLCAISAKPLLIWRRLGDLNPGWARTQTALAERLAS